MKKLLYSVVVAGLLLGFVAGARVAQADPGYYSAMNCQPYSTHPSFNSILWRSNWGGFWYYETSSTNVICPVFLGNSGNWNPTSARMNVYEDSSIDDIACELQLTDDAIGVGLGFRYSQFPAGAATPNVASGMDGFMTWGDPSAAVSGELSAAFACNIGANDGGEYMQVRSYELQY